MKKQHKVLALLGSGVHFDGKLTFDGTVRIDGHYEGEIDASGNLIIGRDAMLDARIRVTCVLISGEVRGHVQATRSIEILPQGKVYGTIEAPKIVIHEGGVLQGNCLTQSPGETAADDTCLTISLENPQIEAVPTEQGIT
jgi:cytoskeletal protein CcmA (bactofilin family)